VPTALRVVQRDPLAGLERSPADARWRAGGQVSHR
jgi:hypothetical protein